MASTLTEKTSGVVLEEEFLVSDLLLTLWPPPCWGSAKFPALVCVKGVLHLESFSEI